MFAVPAQVTRPNSALVKEPDFTNTSFSISCEAYGRDLPSLTLERDGTEVNQSDFIAYEYTVDEAWKYGLDSGYGLRMQWAMDSASATCEIVTRYDSDNYQCVATNLDPDGNSRSNSSSSITVTTRCESFQLFSIYVTTCTSLNFLSTHSNLCLDFH